MQSRMYCILAEQQVAINLRTLVLTDVSCPSTFIHGSSISVSSSLHFETAVARAISIICPARCDSARGRGRRPHGCGRLPGLAGLKSRPCESARSYHDYDHAGITVSVWRRQTLGSDTHGVHMAIAKAVSRSRGSCPPGSLGRDGHCTGAGVPVA